MQTLNQVMEQLRTKAEELRVSNNPVVDELQDVQWELGKKWINSQQANPATVISENKSRVRFKQSGKFNRVQVDLGTINGFEAQFVLYEPISEGEQKSFYAIFNEKTNTAYIRKLWEV